MSYFKPKKIPLSFFIAVVILFLLLLLLIPQSSILLIIITTTTVLTTKIWAQLTFKCCLACHCTCSGFYRLLVSWPSFKNCPRTEKKKHCWMCELLFIRPAKCLYRVPCTLQKHNILYDCMWKQIKLPSKWRCCWIRVSRRSCCWSCKIKCHEKSLNCYKIILKQYTNLLLWKTQKFLTGIEIKIV